MKQPASNHGDSSGTVRVSLTVDPDQWDALRDFGYHHGRMPISTLVAAMTETLLEGSERHRKDVLKRASEINAVRRSRKPE